MWFCDEKLENVCVLESSMFGLAVEGERVKNLVSVHT